RPCSPLLVSPFLLRPPPPPPLFPYTTLFRSFASSSSTRTFFIPLPPLYSAPADQREVGPDALLVQAAVPVAVHQPGGIDGVVLPDRKSTRLNSSHVSTSYAVFCLKKKTSTGT